MNNKIANILKGAIITADLSWVDKIAGLVQTAHIRKKQGETVTTKSYPISCDITADACLDGAYQDLTPDSSKKSVIYFEDGGCNFDHQEGNRLYYNSKLRLVCWLNHKELSRSSCPKEVTGCGTSGDYVIELLKVFDYKPFNSGDIYGIMIHPPSQGERSNDIFSKYSYSEEMTQYLLFPYDFFALDFEITFMIPCLTVPVDD